MATEQTWEQRIREAAYTSPSGVRIKFLYEAVGREFDKRTSAFSFPGVNGSYVQQNGTSARRYPMRCIFTGANHDLEATAFEEAVDGDGIGRLEHPIYGPVDVVPFGSVTRREDLKSEANQSIVELTFWTTVGAVYPSAQIDAKSEIQAALEGFDVVSAQQFAGGIDLASAVDQANGAATFRKALKGISAALDSVSAAVTSVNRTFRDLQSEVNFGMDVLIGQPLLLAQQISNLIKAPARAFSGLETRMEGYARLADTVFGSVAGQPARALQSGVSIARRTTQIANDFRIADLLAFSALAGSLTAVVVDPLDEFGQPIRGQLFTTKPQAIAAAEALLNQFDATVAWREAGFEALEMIGGVHAYQIDTGEAYQAMQGAVALTAGYLIELSFSLVPERRIVLDRPRSVIDLAAELYGDVDGVLDFFISSNEFTGSEILELPRGRGVVYYPR